MRPSSRLLMASPKGPDARNGGRWAGDTYTACPMASKPFLTPGQVCAVLTFLESSVQGQEFGDSRACLFRAWHDACGCLLPEREYRNRVPSLSTLGDTGDRVYAGVTGENFSPQGQGFGNIYSRKLRMGQATGGSRKWALRLSLFHVNNSQCVGDPLPSEYIFSIFLQKQFSTITQKYHARRTALVVSD